MPGTTLGVDIQQLTLLGLEVQLERLRETRDPLRR